MAGWRYQYNLASFGTESCVLSIGLSLTQQNVFIAKWRLWYSSSHRIIYRCHRQPGYPVALGLQWYWAATSRFLSFAQVRATHSSLCFGKWNIQTTGNGIYSIQNVQYNTYISPATPASPGTYLQQSSSPYNWSITPASTVAPLYV